MERYREKESKEYREHRSCFRDNYAYIESYCRNKYNNGNYLDFLSKETKLVETCLAEIIEIIELDYIRSNSYGFQVNPSVKNATDFLRNKLLDKKIELKYTKNLDRAIFVILQAIRDNIIHHGKMETDEAQYQRNFILIKNASLITSCLVNDLKS